MDGGSKVRWISPFPGMDDVDGKGDGIAVSPANYGAGKCMDECEAIIIVAGEQDEGCLPRWSDNKDGLQDFFQ